jgi:polyhydroxybutyrate depolymerase
LAAVLCLVAVACSPPPGHPFGDRVATDLAVSCDAGAATPPGSLRVRHRRALLVAPTGWVPGVAYPLLVSLHPFVAGPEDWESYSGLAAEAADAGYWVLIPKGSDPGPRWAVPGGLAGGPDDVGWIDEVIAETSRQVCLDGRVFAAGFSAGAAMAMALSCELPWRFDAVVASGGSNLTDRCPSGRGGPVDTLILHGTADTIAPLSGSVVIFAPPLGLAVATVVDDAAARNGCGATPTQRVVSVTVVATVFTCASARTEFWEMRGAGHTWAGSRIALDAVAGATDRSISANRVALDFFAADL